MVSLIKPFLSQSSSLSDDSLPQLKQPSAHKIISGTKSIRKVVHKMTVGESSSAVYAA